MANIRLNNPEEDEDYFLSQDIDEHVQHDYVVGYMEQPSSQLNLPDTMYDVAKRQPTKLSDSCK